jgi:uncharacterized protein YacL
MKLISVSSGKREALGAMGGEMIFRIAGLIGFGLAGWRLGLWLAGGSQWQFIPLLVGAVLGAVATPYLTIRPLRWFHHQISRVPTPVLISALAGFFLALVFSGLLTIPLSRLNDPFGRVLPLVFTFLLCFFGTWIMGMRGRELFQLFGLRHFAGELDRVIRMSDKQSLVDTSVIIDGRIADISSTGFLQGTLIIPKFVLEELQHIADSPDSVRRNRGRRGLEILNRLQKESAVPIQILDVDVEGAEDVDGKLVRLARSLNCPILTTDFSLNRVAELQGVLVLNINKLANAVKPVLLPGEEIEVRIIQEGKESGQGVGFLDDGTMVVVEGGRRYLNSRVDTVVTRVLQTATGRMVFAQIKDGASRDKGERG